MEDACGESGRELYPFLGQYRGTAAPNGTLTVGDVNFSGRRSRAKRIVFDNLQTIY